MSQITSLHRLPTDEPAGPDDAEVEPSGGDADEPATPPGGDADEPATPPGVRWWRRPVASRTLTALSSGAVLAAMLLPNKLGAMTPAAFLRIPLEAVVAVGLLLLVRDRARRPLAIIAGVGLGLLVIVKLVDVGFYAILDRPFNPAFDAVLLDDGLSFLDTSIGSVGAAAVVAAIAVLAVLVPGLLALASARVAGVLARHATAAGRGTAAAAVVWLACAAFGVQVAPSVPFAERGTTELLHARAHDVSAGLRDQQVFAEAAATDPFRYTPGNQLLAGLRGKDVMVTFIESYGRSAVEDPQFARGVGAVLDGAHQRLTAKGWAARSGWLTSPTAGGGSWLAHATFSSGLWIDNDQRHRTLMASDRLTLSSAFQRADWETVGVMPGVHRAWPEGTDFYGFDRIHDWRDLGYVGPKFGWSRVPDQYTLSAFQRQEYGKADRAPMMAEIALVSSHGPWVPIPRMIPWEQVGNGSIYHDIAADGESRSEVWTSTSRVRNEYRRAIEYSLGSLMSFVETYGDDDLVLVFLGDHQPVPLVTGEDASHDVPVTIVAKDPAVLDRIASWGWDDGLRPGPDAPVWRMDRFRDKFFTAFGPNG